MHPRRWYTYFMNVSKSMKMRLEGARARQLALCVIEIVLSLCGEFSGDIWMYGGQKYSFPGQCVRKDIKIGLISIGLMAMPLYTQNLKYSNYSIIYLYRKYMREKRDLYICVQLK